MVARLQEQVRGDLERYVGAEQAAVIKALARAETSPVSFKLRIALQALTNPWAGLTALEHHGLRIAEAARAGNASLPALIAALEAGAGRAPELFTPLSIPTSSEPEDHIAYLVAVLEQAHQLREKALRKLSRDDRRFLFDHAASLVEHFIPQVEGLGERTMPQAQADRRFCQLVNEQLDYSALIAAAQVLARLADEEWLQRLSAVFQRAQPQASLVPSPPPGITGEVLVLRQTPYGLIVIGGPGPNTYDLDQRFALVLDVGGDDTYRGMIAAPADVEQGISVVIDLSGNDTYRASPLGLATGRMGVGLLIDRAGDDAYHLSQGSGGAGFAGLGILVDTAGHDRYVGAKFTQGAAVGGLGLLLDQAGNDTYTSFGYAIGFGGPLGVGAVLDVAGDDQYQCGEKYPSNYNATDAPNGKPGDLLFQYECFGLGTGSGKRIYTTDPEQRVYGLAGGWGVLIDLAGNDRYRSSNFSQGCGYFFGVGLKLDMDGDDEHSAARYGHAAGAHFGVGLFIDYRGGDVYTSTGPHYNGGAAWDLSVMLGIDAGPGNDSYDVRRSSGLGIADHRSWSLFIEEGGRDRYLVPNGMGMASHSSMSAFFDLGGEDEYVIAPRSDRAGSGGRANGRVFLDQGGGLFIDR
ncbi:MAG TPA: hypothetical protein VGQ07_01970 [Nitrospirales bacterium]|nr:hypothetical protein [Nitrospirales bacterium]